MADFIISSRTYVFVVIALQKSFKNLCEGPFILASNRNGVGDSNIPLIPCISAKYSLMASMQVKKGCIGVSRNCSPGIF
jgi:hypothetical protein